MIWILASKGAPAVLAWLLTWVVAASGACQSSGVPIASGAPAARVLGVASRVVAALAAPELATPGRAGP